MPAWWSRMERAGLTYGGAWAVPGPRHPGIEQRSAYTAADHEHLPGLLLSVCSRPLAPRVRTGHRRRPGLLPPPLGQLTRLRVELVRSPLGRGQQRGAAEDGSDETEQTTDADEDRASDHESGVELRPRLGRFDACQVAAFNVSHDRIIGGSHRRVVGVAVPATIPPVGERSPLRGKLLRAG